MLNNLSDKQKLWSLTALLILMFWMAWHFAFSKTIELWKACGELEQQKERIKEIPGQLPALKIKAEHLEKILGSSAREDSLNLIAEEINLHCLRHHVTLKEIPEKHLFTGPNLIVETLGIDLQGDFTDQLRVIDALEKSDIKARLRSVKFQSATDQISGEQSLIGTLFFQSIKLIPINPKPTGHEKNKNI